MNALGGHIDLCAGPTGVVYPHVEAKKMQIIGIAALRNHYWGLDVIFLRGKGKDTMLFLSTSIL